MLVAFRLFGCFLWKKVVIHIAISICKPRDWNLDLNNVTGSRLESRAAKETKINANLKEAQHQRRVSMEKSAYSAEYLIIIDYHNYYYYYYYSGLEAQPVDSRNKHVCVDNDYWSLMIKTIHLHMNLIISIYLYIDIIIIIVIDVFILIIDLIDNIFVWISSYRICSVLMKMMYERSL